MTSETPPLSKKDIAYLADAKANLENRRRFRRAYQNWLDNTHEGRQEKDNREERLDALKEKWERQGR